MSNPTVATPIIDKNGKATTVHKKADGKTAGSRVKSVAAPVLTVPKSSGYKAPNAAPLHKMVDYDGDVMSWGQVLEEIQPIGIRRILIDNTPIWAAVHPENPNLSTNIPISVAKASGLKDITDPITQAADDHSLALIKLDKLEADIPPFLRGSGITNEWHDRVQEQQREVKELEKKRDDLKRSKEYEAIADMTPEQRKNNVYANNAGKYQTEAFVDYALDNDDIELAKSVGNFHNRVYLGSEHREKLITHEDEGVRGAFISGNSSLSSLSVFRVAESDPSPFVRSVAQSNLDQRGIKAWRDERGDIRVDEN